MSRYFNADATLSTIRKYLYETAMNNFTTNRKFADACEEIAEHRIATWIDAIPTADVVEVVRCKDCKFWTTNLKNPIKRNNYCDRLEAGNFFKCDENDYCSKGERKEVEE